jgi:hypothetical protein
MSHPLRSTLGPSRAPIGMTGPYAIKASVLPSPERSTFATFATCAPPAAIFSFTHPGRRTHALRLASLVRIPQDSRHRTAGVVLLCPVSVSGTERWGGIRTRRLERPHLLQQGCRINDVGDRLLTRRGPVAAQWRRGETRPGSRAPLPHSQAARLNQETPGANPRQA